MSVADGDARRGKGDLSGALAAYDQALAANPGDLMALVNRGVTFHMLGRAAEAATDYAKAAALAPQIALIHANLAAALLDAHKPGSARDAALKAVELEPSNVTAWNNLGVACGQLGLARDAQDAWRKALAIDPDHASTLVNLAQASRVDDPDKAADLFLRVLAKNPARDDAYAEAISTLWHACRWDRALELLGELDARLARGMATNALYSLAYTLPFMADDPARVKKAQTALGAALARAATKLPPVMPGTGKIVVGYLSPDFGNHAMSHVLRSMIAAHDKSRFEIVLLSLKDRSSEPGPWLADLKRAADDFVDLSAMDSPKAAAATRARKIDVLVDLSGYMAGGRPEILAARPAPVQVYWIGHGGFLEAPYIDYTIADAIVALDPAGHVEAIARLPVCYHPADRFPAGPAPTRAELGLPENAIIFAAFCNPLKIEPVCFAAWLDVLKRVPGSVLWLAGRKAYTPAQSQLRARAQVAGIDPARLIFAPHAADKAAHLARHRAADLFLDSFAVSAASTALDALGAGLPVLTKRGQQAHANVAASFLSALGLPELIAATVEDFVARAVGLAQDKAARDALRARLDASVAVNLPFDASRMARHVEAAFAAMIERARAGLKPASFDVTAP
ncbi:MAG: tetratricopeptide repeat protein [Alphaproteobacteria bacterium]|nr:tetratricopeptide repeat protein [Alphaproteobacteria bacterium]